MDAGEQPRMGASFVFNSLPILSILAIDAVFTGAFGPSGRICPQYCPQKGRQIKTAPFYPIFQSSGAIPNSASK